MRYVVIISNKAKKNIKSIPILYKNRIKVFVAQLEETIFPIGYDILKAEGLDNTYRCRIGIYRIVYQLQDNRVIVEVLNIAHRKEVYR